MPIIVDDGRPRSVRDLKEERERLLTELAAMSDGERTAFLEMAEKLGGNFATEFSNVVEVDYRVRPVSIDRFFTDSYYLGHIGQTIYPRLKEDLHDLFEGDYTEGALGGSIGWGKSYFATCAMAYVLYQMSCLRDPQRAYGLSQGSNIYIAMLAPSEKVARRVAVSELMGKIEHSPYFREQFKWERYAPSSLEIQFPSRIWVVAGSTRSTAIIGLNVFSGFVDETSFMGEQKTVDSSGKYVVEDLGEKIHKSIVRRIKSRFQQVGRLPGLLLTVSSKERPTAFIEKRIQQAKDNNDPGFFVREYATWDVKPGNYSGKVFHVVAGNEKIRSRILPDDANVEAETIRWADMGVRVIAVPIEWRNDFERDIDNALREIAGIATESIVRFMSRIEKITAAADRGADDLVNPLGDEGSGEMHTWVAGTPLVIRWGEIADPIERRLPGGVMEQHWRPKRHPAAARYAHWDSSLTGDCTGLVIAHVARWKEVIRRDPFGEEYAELAPVIETDLVLRIKPPAGDEIMMSDVRSVLYQFQAHGFLLSYVSMDQYQSADSLQQLKKRGIEAEVVSVDRTTDAYDTLKDAIYEDRAVIHPHPWLEAELRNVQRIMKRGRARIDHPDRMTGPDGTEVIGSKDVADALAGVTYSLVSRMPGRPVPIVKGATFGHGQEKPDHSWVSGGKVMVSEKGGRKDDGRSIVKGTPTFDPADGPLPFIKG